jgi:hypothetical protein
MHKIRHPKIPCALSPVLQNDSMPPPRLLKSYALDSDSESEENKKMATPFRNNTRSEECGKSRFGE